LLVTLIVIKFVVRMGVVYGHGDSPVKENMHGS